MVKGASGVKHLVKGKGEKKAAARPASPPLDAADGSNNPSAGAAASKKGAKKRPPGPGRDVVKEFNEIARQLHLEGMCTATATAIKRLLQCERASVLLVDRQANTLVAQTGAAGSHDSTRLVISLESNGLTASVAVNGVTEVIDDVGSDPRFDASFD
eukprot:3210479-Prymnesium_polylepis.1